MSGIFAISGHNLPYVRSYEQAKKVWEESHQHDRFGRERGLVNKRDISKTICNMDGVFAFKYHDTSLVTWWKDLLIAKCYDSRSSVIFANRFLPPGIDARNVGGEMYIVQNGRYFLPKHTGVEFRLKKGQWVVDESTLHTHTQYKLDKSKAAKVRMVLKPFREYRDSVLRIRGGNHNAEWSDEWRLCQMLRMGFDEGKITDQLQRDMLTEATAYDDDILLKSAYLLGGAVGTEAVNDRPKLNNPFAGRKALHNV